MLEYEVGVSGAVTPGPDFSNVSVPCQCEGNYTDDDGEENQKVNVIGKN